VKVSGFAAQDANATAHKDDFARIRERPLFTTQTQGLNVHLSGASSLSALFRQLQRVAVPAA
jgi:hypothetical protein